MEIEDRKFPLLKTTVLERNPNRILEIRDVETFDKFTNTYGYVSDTSNLNKLDLKSDNLNKLDLKSDNLNKLDLKSDICIEWNSVAKDFRGLSLKLDSLSDRKEKAFLSDKECDSWIKLEWLPLEKDLVVFVRGSKPVETRESDMISIDKKQLDNSIGKLMSEFKETMQFRLKTSDDRDKVIQTFCTEAEANLKDQTSSLVKNLPFLNEMLRTCLGSVQKITDKSESNDQTDFNDIQSQLFQSANGIVNSINLNNESDKNLESKSNSNVVRCYHCSE